MKFRARRIAFASAEKIEAALGSLLLNTIPLHTAAAATASSVLEPSVYINL